jgi:hypothetical protein
MEKGREMARKLGLAIAVVAFAQGCAEEPECPTGFVAEEEVCRVDEGFVGNAIAISRGAALECSSCLDVLVARKRLQTDEVAEGKAMIVRIVSMLSKLIEKLLGPGSLAEQKTRSVSSRSRVRRA